MLPRSKLVRVLLFAVPLILAAALWFIARNQRPRFVKTPAMVESLALSYDGSRLAVAADNGQILWRGNGRLQILPIETANTFNAVNFAFVRPTLQFARDGQTLFGSEFMLSSDSTKTAYAWNLATDKIAWSAASAYKDDFSGYSFARDATKLAQHSYDVVKVLDLTKTGAPIKNQKSRYAREFPVLMRVRVPPFAATGRSGFPDVIALSADNSQMIIADTNGRLQFWSVATGKKVNQSAPAPMPASNGNFGELKPSRDGRYVALTDRTSVALWDSTTGVWTQSALTLGTLHNVVWMPDSRSLWLSGFVAPLTDNDKTQRLSVPQLKPLRILPTWGPVAVSGDGRMLATRTYQGDGVWLWNIG